MERDARILVAGSPRFVGAAVRRRLRAGGHAQLLELDGTPLRDAAAVESFFAQAKPTHVFLLGGASGGIQRNQREPASLLLDNLAIETAVLPAAQRHRVRKLVYLAAACIYPRECEQPMRPAQLGTGPIEPTSEAYAMAKWTGLVLCQALAREHGACFVTAIPANPFGPGDDTRSADAHVVGALVRRMHEAKVHGEPEVAIWGSGRARRDFLFVDDLADALVFAMDRWDDATTPFNVSGGSDVSIGELAEAIRKTVGYEGRLVLDAAKPDGAPRKTLDGSALAALGWTARTPLADALAATYRAFLATEECA